MVGGGKWSWEKEGEEARVKKEVWERVKGCRRVGTRWTPLVGLQDSANLIWSGIDVVVVLLNIMLVQCVAEEEELVDAVVCTKCIFFKSDFDCCS